MKRNKKIILIMLAATAAAAILTSCGEGTTSRLTAAEVEDYEEYIMSSYFIERGDAALPESRTAWDYTYELQYPAAGGTTTATSNNYPEKGQRTTVTITPVEALADVYKVVNLTTYDRRNSIDHTTESYYVKDTNSDGYLTKAIGDGTYATDPICDADGNENSLYRSEFTTVFDDGTERNETIYANSNADGGSVSYAMFDIDDPLVFPNPDESSTLGGGQFNGDNTEWSPGTGAADWSSMVTYDQSIKYDLWIWTYTKHMIGVRYYTEQTVSTKKVKTSVAYERTIATLADSTDVGVYGEWFQRFFSVRNTSDTGSADNTTYTETVIRKRIEGSKKTQINSQSNVYDQTGASIVTFTANYETDDDGVVLSSGAPVAAYQ